MSSVTKVIGKLRRARTRVTSLIRLVRHSLERTAFEDQARLLSGCDVQWIFDVGASDGKYAATYHRLFPRARVVAFEPHPDSFKLLAERAKKASWLEPVNAAVSDRAGTEVLHMNERPTTSSLLPSATTGDKRIDEFTTTRRIIEINTVTLDQFCNDRGIERIDILKMDIQGGELKALEGSHGLLVDRRIGLVYTEVEFTRLYENQPLFAHISGHLDKFGYQLYGVYHQVYTGFGQLGWADSIFYSPDLGKPVTS